MSVVAYFLNERGLSRFATINIFSPPLFRLITEVMLNGRSTSTEVVKCYAASYYRIYAEKEQVPYLLSITRIFQGKF